MDTSSKTPNNGTDSYRIQHLDDDTANRIHASHQVSSVEQMAVELFTNSVEGQAKHITITAGSSEGCCISLTVCDDGAGVHADNFRDMGRRGFASSNSEPDNEIGAGRRQKKGSSLANISHMGTLRVCSRRQNSSSLMYAEIRKDVTRSLVKTNLKSNIDKVYFDDSTEYTNHLNTLKQRITLDPSINTIIAVENIFDAIPVRKKYALYQFRNLKKYTVHHPTQDSRIETMSEGVHHIIEAIAPLALYHSRTSVDIIDSSTGKKLFSKPATDDIPTALKSLVGHDKMQEPITVNIDYNMVDEVVVHAVFSSVFHHNRAFQFVYINGTYLAPESKPVRHVHSFFASLDFTSFKKKLRKKLKLNRTVDLGSYPVFYANIKVVPREESPGYLSDNETISILDRTMNTVQNEALTTDDSRIKRTIVIMCVEYWRKLHESMEIRMADDDILTLSSWEVNGAPNRPTVPRFHQDNSQQNIEHDLIPTDDIPKLSINPTSSLSVHHNRILANAREMTGQSNATSHDSHTDIYDGGTPLQRSTSAPRTIHLSSKSKLDLSTYPSTTEQEDATQEPHIINSSTGRTYVRMFIKETQQVAYMDTLTGNFYRMMPGSNEPHPLTNGDGRPSTSHVPNSHSNNILSNTVHLTNVRRLKKQTPMMELNSIIAGMKQFDVESGKWGGDISNIPTSTANNDTEDTEHPIPKRVARHERRLLEQFNSLQMLNLTSHAALGINFITKSELQGMTVVGQADNKFIVCSLVVEGEVKLYVVDQHAADERCRLEMIYRTLLNTGPDQECPTTPSANQSYSIVNSVPVPEYSDTGFHLSRYELLEINRVSRDYLVYWGFHINEVTSVNEEDSPRPVSASSSHATLTSYITFSRLPAGIIHRLISSSNSKLLKDVIMQLVRDEPRFNQWQLERKETLASHLDTPPAIRELVASVACRGAVMFGTEMTKTQCEVFLEELKRCQNPFQCAHGRPTIAPLANMKSLFTSQKKTDACYSSDINLQLFTNDGDK